ncbi:unnamed protein product [Brassica oleracea var. botrytis]
MGGGGNLVDGVRRWLFHRPSSSSFNDKHETIVLKSDTFSNPDQSGVSNELILVTEDLDFSGLKLIKVPKRNHLPIDPQKKGVQETEFFTEYGEANRYEVQEVVGKGSYGVVAVASALDTHTGERVAIKKINDVEFRDIYVVFELMESDLHQVIKANDDLTPKHYQFFLYQLLSGLKYVHAANVFHRDLKPKNILANADCKLKICDFELARVSFNDALTAIFWTDYVATRWYCAPELCGSFFSKYTPAIDIWSVGCIFAEMLLGKPLFPGKNVVHQLDLMTDFLGTPPPESISKIRNEKARRYLSSMREKQPVPFSHKFLKADPLALRLLERLLAFDPKDRASAEDAVSDPYFSGLSNSEREPSTQPISKLEFDFERKKLNKDDVRELIYREILEYHPQMLEEYKRGGDQLSFLYPSGVDRFKRQFAYLEENQGKPGAGGGRSTALHRHHASLPRERVPAPNGETAEGSSDVESRAAADVASTLESEEAENGGGYSARSLMKSASISGSKCINVQSKTDKKDIIAEDGNDETVSELTDRVASLHNS